MSNPLHWRRHLISALSKAKVKLRLKGRRFLWRMAPIARKKCWPFLPIPQPIAGKKIRRIDTHASTVFLAKDRALKVKRAVRFPFLDYSTLEKRKAACEAEIKVNAPYAPQIYRGVVPITRDAGGKLAVGGSGAAVEWAVEMARFDENCTLDHLAGEIDSALADALGRVVAAAHRRARPLDGNAWIDALGAYIDEHADAFGQHPRIFPRDDVLALARKSRAAYAAQSRRSCARETAAASFAAFTAIFTSAISCCSSGKPVLFDAIEFSDIIASGDVLYDLAFLLMDLLERGLEQPANIVLQPVSGRDPTPGGFGRTGGVAVLSVDARGDSRQGHRRAAGTRCRGEAPGHRAHRRANTSRSRYGRSHHRSPRLVTVGGLSGTGKSQLAQSLAADIAPMPGAVVVRSDLERKTLFDGRRDREVAGKRLFRRGYCADLRDACRQGAPHPYRRTFRDHRCRVRARSRACRGRGCRKIRECSVSGALSDRRS